MNRHHLSPAFYIIIMIAFAACTRSAHTDTRQNNRFEKLKQEAYEAAIKLDRQRSDSLGQLLTKEAREAGDNVYEAYGLLAQSVMFYGAPDLEERLKRVEKAQSIAMYTENDSLISTVYNILGMYATTLHPDFTKARICYTYAIRYARKGGYPDYALRVECNLAELYRMNEDTIGIVYDRDIYMKALATGDSVLLRASAKRCANYYLTYSREKNLALPYIVKLEEMGEKYHSNLLRGKLYLNEDSLEKAGIYLQKALGDTLIHTPNVYYSYAEYLARRKDYRKSNMYLDSAKAAYEMVGETRYRYNDINKVRSANYRSMGMPDSALLFLNVYLAGKDSLNQIRNRDELNFHKVRFDVEKKEMELARTHAVIKRQTTLIWSGVTLLAMAVIFLLVFKLYRRKAKKNIVRIQRNRLLDMNAMMPEKKQQAPDIQESEEPARTKNGLSDTKADKIWNDILGEMRVNRIYTDVTVTRETFSERIGCNHTWLTQVIKEKTGKSYTQFMNSWRVDEATKRLSDPTMNYNPREMALSLGFLSLSNFYSAFKRNLGMSPAEYRKLALQEQNHS